MRGEEKANVKNSIGRVVLVGLAVLLQLAWIIVLFARLNRYSALISLLTSVLALLLVIIVYNLRINASLKMPWIILIAAFPVLGVTLYLLIEGSRRLSGDRRCLEAMEKSVVAAVRPELPTDCLSQFEKRDVKLANQAHYLELSCSFPLYRETKVTFYPEADEGLEAQIKDLRQARSFIFMEYHAIEDSTSFARVREVLAERARAGVDVRVFYDDLGSFGFINRSFISRMEADGIACRVFNPMVPFLKVFMDNRDHRKITVVDGRVGYTGGYNLADEYFGLTHPYGHWKDTGVRLEGPAVESLTTMFLTMWHVMDRTAHRSLRPKGMSQEDLCVAGLWEDVSFIRTNAPRFVETDEGYVQPYADDPYGSERVGENVYLNALKGAQRYAWFMTPYLIITDDMAREMELAAKRGVDVRVITPGVPDKKLVWRITRSYYSELIDGGVRVYEYAPGFCHAKQCVVDDELATVGTINLDFRSLYHHFENGVLLMKCPAVADVRRDFEETFAQCRQITAENLPSGGPLRQVGTAILRLASPLL